MHQVLIAVNDLTAAHVGAMEEVAAGWGRCVRIDQAADEATYRAALKQSHAALGWIKPQWLIDSPVAFYQLASVGYDPYNIPAIRNKPGFILCNARGVMSIPVAEHFIALMFALARRIPQHVRDQQLAHWERCASYGEITGSTVCILGLGAIGQEIALRCKALGMNVIAVEVEPEKANTSHVSACFDFDHLDDALAQADHVVLSLPATPQTIGLFQRERFRVMKHGACFYNLSRGEIVNEQALIEALLCGQVGGAGLDVFAVEPLPPDHPLWQLENVIITPHAGGRSVHEFDRLAALFTRNLRHFRKGQPLENMIINNPATHTIQSTNERP